MPYDQERYGENTQDEGYDDDGDDCDDGDEDDCDDGDEDHNDKELMTRSA